MAKHIKSKSKCQKVGMSGGVWMAKGDSRVEGALKFFSQIIPVLEKLEACQ